MLVWLEECGCAGVSVCASCVFECVRVRECVCVSEGV